ncbi:MAG: VWA domain-containing protein [Acidobacteriia bacterium]|nr:VWA domain-containing protein [Terriglobia bacterium]
MTCWIGIGLSDEIERPSEPRVSITPRTPVEPNSATQKSASIRLDVKVVQISVTVTDPWDRPVAGLRPNDFRLFEDDVEQKIVYLSGEEAPASVGLIFDASGSMRDKIETSVAAVDQFFQTSLPGDEFLLVRFSDKPTLITGFTDDTREISGWLHSIRPKGWTALHDAIYLGIQKMKTARNSRKALLVLSDGGDNNSRYSAPEIRDLVRESDVRIYSIGLQIGMFQGGRFLEKISDEAGGRMIRVRKLEELPEAMEKLSRDLRSQYLLGYYSTNAQNDGRFRRVRVQVNHPTVHASWRRGYYAPAE